jgi:hypothetical protein
MLVQVANSILDEICKGLFTGRCLKSVGFLVLLLSFLKLPRVPPGLSAEHLVGLKMDAQLLCTLSMS